MIPLVIELYMGSPSFNQGSAWGGHGIVLGGLQGVVSQISLNPALSVPSFVLALKYFETTSGSS
jgi:hypothetical protein